MLVTPLAVTVRANTISSQTAFHSGGRKLSQKPLDSKDTKPILGEGSFETCTHTTG